MKLWTDDGWTMDGRRTDYGRTTDGRTPDHGHPISSPCEPNGSGELIRDSLWDDEYTNKATCSRLVLGFIKDEG